MSRTWPEAGRASQGERMAPVSPTDLIWFGGRTGRQVFLHGPLATLRTVAHRALSFFG